MQTAQNCTIFTFQQTQSRESTPSWLSSHNQPLPPHSRVRMKMIHKQINKQTDKHFQHYYETKQLKTTNFQNLANKIKWINTFMKKIPKLTSNIFRILPRKQTTQNYNFFLHSVNKIKWINTSMTSSLLINHYHNNLQLARRITYSTIIAIQTPKHLTIQPTQSSESTPPRPSSLTINHCYHILDLEWRRRWHTNKPKIKQTPFPTISYRSFPINQIQTKIHTLRKGSR